MLCGALRTHTQIKKIREGTHYFPAHLKSCYEHISEISINEQHSNTTIGIFNDVSLGRSAVEKGRETTDSMFSVEAFCCKRMQEFPHLLNFKSFLGKCGIHFDLLVSLPK